MSLIGIFFRFALKDAFINFSIVVNILEILSLLSIHHLIVSCIILPINLIIMGITNSCNSLLYFLRSVNYATLVTARLIIVASHMVNFLF